MRGDRWEQNVPDRVSWQTLAPFDPAPTRCPPMAAEPVGSAPAGAPPATADACRGGALPLFLLSFLPTTAAPSQVANGRGGRRLSARSKRLGTHRRRPGEEQGHLSELLPLFTLHVHLAERESGA
jgi:hypothetical protein